MHIAGQPCCARFIVRETEAHVGGDSGPRLEFSATSRCREVVSQQRLGGVPFAGPRHPAAAGHLHPGTSRPSRALGRLGWGAPCRLAPRHPPPRHARRGSSHEHCHPRAPCPGSALRVPALGPIRRPRPHSCLAPRADLAAPRTPLSVAQVSRGDRASLTGSRRSGSPGPAHRQRPPRPPQPLHREPGAARPLARSPPRSRAQPARAPGRSRAEPPRGRTEKRGWSRPSPR